MANYYIKQGKQSDTQGPFTSQDIRQLAEEGRLESQDFISRDQVEWFPCSSVEDLFPEKTLSAPNETDIHEKTHTRVNQHKKVQRSKAAYISTLILLTASIIGFFYLFTSKTISPTYQQEIKQTNIADEYHDTTITANTAKILAPELTERHSLSTVAYADIPVKESDVTYFNRPVITDTNGWDKKPPKYESYLAMSDDELRACVPYQTPRIYSHCPNCSQKVNGRDYSRRHFPNDFNFDPKKPYQIECKKCGETYPDNKKFPQTHTAEKLAPQMWRDLPKGNFVTIRWHQQTRKKDPKTMKKGDKPTYEVFFYMDGALDTNRDRYCQAAMTALTKAYWYYKDKDAELAYKCAWKVAVLLDAYADALPRWLLCDNYGKDYYDCRSKDFPYGWSETRYGSARQTGEQNGPGFFKSALDVICETKAFKDYSKKLGESLFDKSIRNVLKPVRRFQTAGLGKMEQGAPIQGSVSYAKMTNDRELLRLMMQSMETFPKRFTVDGGFGQGPGYSGIHLNACASAINSFRGYTDPLDYKVPVDSPNKERWSNSYFPEDMPYLGLIKHYNAAAPGKLEDFWRRSFQFWHDLEMPDGGVWSFNECSHRILGSKAHVMGEPHHTSKTVFKTGLKRLVLADGEGDDQIALHLGFGKDTKHGHGDYMDLLIFDNGHWLADDFGYGKHQMRARYSSPQVHNTATIDEISSPDNNGRPLLFESNIPGLQVMKVGTPTTEIVEQFERTVALVTTDIKHPYIFDLFLIKGKGDADKVKRREYLMHSTKDSKQIASNSLPMKKLPGERALHQRDGKKWEENMLNSKDYGVFFDVKGAQASSYFTMDFEVDDPWKPIMWKPNPKSSGHTIEIKGKTPTACLPFKAKDDSYADKPAIGLRRHIVASPGMEAFQFNMPHPSQLHKNKHSEGWGRMPGFMLRHEVENTKEASEFIVIHEGWQGKPYITKVNRLPKKYGSANTLAVEIILPDRKDVIVMSTDNNVATYKGAGIDFSGRFGFISNKKDGKADGALIGGTKLAGGAVNYTLEKDEYSGNVTGSERRWRGKEADGLYVDQDLPKSLIGSWMLVNVNGQSLPPNPREVNGFVSKVQGGGWAFRIRDIFKKNGKTFVQTEEEHGLEISPSTCREFFFPMTNTKGQTKFQIYPSSSNQAKVILSHPGGALSGPTKVSMKSASEVPGAKIEYLIVNKDAAPIYSVDDKILNWKTYSEPVMIDKSCRLLVRALGANGIKVPMAQRIEYNMAPTPLVKGIDELKTGLIVFERYHKYKHDQLLGINISTEPQAKNPYLQKGQRESANYLHGHGLIKITKSGYYNFHYRPRRSGTLKIGGETLLNGSALQFMQATCYLQEGYHDLEFVSEGSNFIDLEISAPDLPRRRLRQDELYHRPAQLEKYVNEFKTQKPLR